MSPQRKSLNHLSEIGKALTYHHAVHRLFPSNGGWDSKARDGTDVQVYTKDATLSTPFYWGVGDPKRGPRDQTGSWAYAILPYLGQETMHRNRDWAQPVPPYHCASRRLPVARTPQDDAYGSYQGGGWSWGHIDYGANGWAITNRPNCLASGDIKDGAAYTILVGEKAMRPDFYDASTWYWDEPFFLGGSLGTQRIGLGILRDSMGMGFTFRNNWGSPHPAGANFLFFDGSVRTHLRTSTGVVRPERLVCARRALRLP